ncbi:MAG: ATP-binding protein, partial [Alphaproteobacteria bacterium]|nr:ATP-binding protein [Alphaproteobacteria bacterium]
LIGLFIAVERRTEADVRALQNILGEEVPRLAKRLQDAGVDYQADQAVINNLYSGIERKKTDSRVLFALISFSGFLLFGFLFCNARCYQRKFKQAQIAEHYSALFAAALQSTRKGVMIQDMREAERPIVFVNKAFAALTGYDQVLLGGKKPDILFGWHTDKAAVSALEQTIRHKESATFDFLIYRKDGSSFWSEWHISPITDSRGKLTHYVIFLTDITGLRQTREALLLAKEQAEYASVVKGNFLATMSHEIRTPLNGLLGVLEIMSDSPLNEDQRCLLDVAVSSGRSLHEIINDILDYTKIEAGKINIVAQPFSLKELLKNVVDLTQPAVGSKHLKVTLEIQEDVPDRLISDDGRIRQVLLNLLANGVKYTEGGYVKLRVSHLLSKAKDDQRVALLRFEVIDSGIGISAVDQDKLFKEFSRIEHANTRRFSGTGLGLAISRRLVKLLNGEIGVESKPGQGSKFWFMLPLPMEEIPEKPGARALPVQQALAGQDPKNYRLLLVEDNETNRLVASRYIEKAGYRYDAAVTGAEAISIVKARTYDLILMDISMPDVDGFEATRRIRAMGGWAAKVPIIALTAHVMQGDRERCLAAGMNDHLGKPLNYETLVRTIGMWVEAAVQTAGQEFVAVEQTVSATETPEIDMTVLQRLFNDLGAGAMLRITESFLDDLAKRKIDLNNCGKTLILESIERTAHTLKSSSANCGLMRFSELMASLEKTAHEGDRKGVQTLFQQLDPAYIAARQALTGARSLYESIS